MLWGHMGIGLDLVQTRASETMSWTECQLNYTLQDYQKVGKRRVGV